MEWAAESCDGNAASSGKSTPYDWAAGVNVLPVSGFPRVGDAPTKQVEDMPLGVFDALKTPVLQVEGLLNLFEPSAVPALRGRYRGDRPVS